MTAAALAPRPRLAFLQRVGQEWVLLVDGRPLREARFARAAHAVTYATRRGYRVVDYVETF